MTESLESPSPEVLSALQEATEEVNANRFDFGQFLQENYSTPFAALIACLHQVRELRKHGIRAGIDVDAVLDSLEMR